MVIGKGHPQKAGQIVHLGIYKDWEELDRLMRNFKVSRCVVDALPETRNARAFAERHRGRVFLCYYSEHQKGHYKWNEAELIVSCNRTESLDASHRETGALYWHIAGAIGWPGNGAPGFAVIVGVEKRDELQPVYQALEEVEAPTPTELLERCLELRDKYGFQEHSDLLQFWYGDPYVFLQCLRRQTYG